MKFLVSLLLTICAFMSLSFPRFSANSASFQGPEPNQDPVKSKATKADAEKKVGELRGLKVQVDEFKNLVKDSYKNEKHPSLIAARKAYINAKAANERFLGAFLEAIRDGDQKNLLKDKGFQKTGEEAERRAWEFVALVDSLTNPNEAAAANTALSNKSVNRKMAGAASPFGLTDVVGAAITVWKAWKDDVRTQRNAKADRLQSELGWNPWNPPPEPAPSPSASPKPSVVP